MVQEVFVVCCAMLFYVVSVCFFVLGGFGCLCSFLLVLSVQDVQIIFVVLGSLRLFSIALACFQFFE